MSHAANGTIPPSTVPPTRRSAPLLTWMALTALASGAVIASNAFSVRDRLLGTALPDPVVPATSRSADQPARAAVDRTTLRSAPWWQVVTTLEGTGPTTSEPFTIDPRAVDWRVTSSCAAGHLVVRSPHVPRPLLDAECPHGVGHSDRKGSTRLEVSADGPWSLEVAQRIDTPLLEPLLPAMAAPGTRVVASGDFYKVDRVGAGRVTIYEQADGRLAVRLEDFWVTPRSSLQLRLSTAGSPRTTREYLAGESQLLATMDVTAGSLNYLPPGGVDPPGFRSVVVWSPSDNHVYAAASLEPPT